MKTKVEIITEEAWEAFAAWIAEHDPDGEMNVLDQATVYGKWCDSHLPKRRRAFQ